MQDLDGIDPEVLLAAIERKRAWFWSDAERHRAGRLDLIAAHREVARLAFDEVGLERSPAADRIATSYYARRNAAITPFPDAVETVRWLRDAGCRLALLTNGAALAQRSKVDRFALAGLFDVILIEGELGYGKPDPRVYQKALVELDVVAAATWMVGDNPEWDVAEPQRHGIFAIWVDRWGRGLPEGDSLRPDRIVRRLSELREPAPGAERA